MVAVEPLAEAFAELFDAARRIQPLLNIAARRCLAKVTARPLHAPFDYDARLFELAKPAVAGAEFAQQEVKSVSVARHFWAKPPG